MRFRAMDAQAMGRVLKRSRSVNTRLMDCVTGKPVRVCCADPPTTGNYSGVADNVIGTTRINVILIHPLQVTNVPAYDSRVARPPACMRLTATTRTYPGPCQSHFESTRYCLVHPM